VRGLVGVDIGGSGIKAGVVDARRGALIGDRVRVPTPQPALVEDVVAATAALVAGLPRDAGPVGIGVPGAIVGGRVMTAANIDASWIGRPARRAAGPWWCSTTPTPPASPRCGSARGGACAAWCSC
jgi:polyphosphate glucokinase